MYTYLTYLLSPLTIYTYIPTYLPTQRALTCDTEGSFRLWAIEKAVGSRAVCVGQFDSQTHLATIKPRAFALSWDLSIVLSSNGLSLLECFRTRRKEAPLHARFRYVGM